MNTKVPLPAGTTLGKSFEYGLDVNLGTFANPDWQPFRRISGFQPTPTPTTMDAQTYDDQGAPNSDVTGWGWAVAFIAQVNRSLATGKYLPEVEYLLARTRPSAKAEAAVADVRWYHKPELGTPNPTDAGRGFCTVGAQRQNTGPGGEIENLNFTLTGKGSYEEIVNPFTGWGSTAPTISGIPEVLAGDGDLFTINGTGLIGTTAVTIDDIATEFTTVGAGSIIAQMLPGDAGSVAIEVTTPGGSATFSYTRGA